MSTFYPPVIPNIESTTTFNSNVVQASFGDGYEQTATLGLNPVAGTYQVSWDILSIAQRDEIEDFFKGLAGAQAFFYTFPSESNPRKFKCKTWTRGSNGALFTLRAEFREVFDVDVVESLPTLLTTPSAPGASLTENSAEGVAIANLVGLYPGATVTLPNTAGGRVKLVGTQLQAGPTNTDYEVSSSLSVTVRQVLAGAFNSPLNTIITIPVVNLSEGGAGPPPDLVDVTAPGAQITENSVEGTVVGNLDGVTSGATVTLIATNGGRIKLVGTQLQAGATNTDYESTTSLSITVRQTLAGASNSPLDTVLSIPVVNVDEGGETSTDDPATWSQLFYDPSTKPLSIRRGVYQTVGSTTWGPFSHYSMTNNAHGTYTTFEWTEGFAQADPYHVSTRRDDMTVLLNMASDDVRNSGYSFVRRDTSAGRTYLRAQRKLHTPAANIAPAADPWGRGVTDFLGAMLNTQHSLFGPAPYEVTWTGVRGVGGVSASWEALWAIQSTSHQAFTDPTGTDADKVDGPHTEQDFWERTGFDNGAGFMTDQVLMNHIYYQPDLVPPRIAGWNGYFHDVGEAIAGTDWDVRAVVRTDVTEHYIKKSVDSVWVHVGTTPTYPAASHFGTEPQYFQMDLKGGKRDYDASADWVDNITGSTVDYEFSWATFRVAVPSSNVSNWTNRTIDPITIPALTGSWSSPGAIDNSSPAGTTIAAFTSTADYTYSIKGVSSMAFTGNLLKLTGHPPAGTREVTIWATRNSDGALFLVEVRTITILNNYVWYDVTATLDLNWETQEAYSHGIPAVWSDWVNTNGTLTSAAGALFLASSGHVAFRGQDASAAILGLYGDNSHQFMLQFNGSTHKASMTGISGEHEVTISGMTNAYDPFVIGFAWGQHAGQSGGAPNSIFLVANGATYLDGQGRTISGTTGPVWWNNPYGDRPFTGIKKRTTFYTSVDLGGVSGNLIDAAFTAKCTSP